ncbi:MAG TPA: hypothetical protein VFK48_01755 [Usitatibacter sp.]|nr:hypothetical protein [Usitatibacter sp.]
MLKRKLLLAALAASTVGLLPLPSMAQHAVYIDSPPPPPRHEVLPAHRNGYVWQPGYWDWRNGRHVWVRGYWVKERRGMYWHPNRWEQRDGRWHFERGRWDRERWADNHYRGRGGPDGDRDRDGVPNRFDRDKDGDGVPNRYDSNPNNPRR